ncbi:hypothetical protein F5Y15DRAFT_407853 [Xylariaceae sp. FL0016]|nr:hypothetical protein F5Y15DRAFT_407853 [Xylariaceae sp. FL0016]
MSPPRRRSARIASSSKRSRTSPAPNLGSLTERDESPDELQQDHNKSLNAIMSSPMPHPRTPSVATPVKLPMSEMHPSKVHQTMAPPSSGLKLGFTDIDYTKDQSSGIRQSTPSKTPLPSSAFTFRHERPGGDFGLGPEAQRMMDDLREEAARIKEDLAAKEAQEHQEEGNANDGRVIAKAKGKAGRFSAVHMAEFKKMDSIANHPSLYRTQYNLATPAKGSLKRSQSKADLDEPESARSKTVPARRAPRLVEQQRVEPESPVKRARQRIEDDTASSRPMSRDGSNIPRPKSSGNDSVRSGIPRAHTHGSLMTPTKASLARATGPKPTAGGLSKSPSKPELGSLARSQSKPEPDGLARSPSKSSFATLTRSPSKKGFAGLTKSVSIKENSTIEQAPTVIQTPGRFHRMKSILKRQFSASKPKSNLPHFPSMMAKTPSRTEDQRIATAKTPSRNDHQELLTAPVTTPGRKVERHVDFTPETKRATINQNSPSPVKSSLPRSKTMTKLPPPNFGSSISSAKKQKDADRDVTYPDLSAYTGEASRSEQQKPERLPESVPGTFTFRSDHTIRFESLSPNGFGAKEGQSSLRHVQDSAIPALRIPGSFPRNSEISPNKENQEPVPGGIPHGMSNKKRHRATWDTEDEEIDEGAKRGAKKLRKDPPTAEGHAVVAPRLAIQKSPTKNASRLSHTPSPQKKKTGLSASRLNMLARPKIRK